MSTTLITYIYVNINGCNDGCYAWGRRETRRKIIEPMDIYQAITIEIRTGEHRREDEEEEKKIPEQSVEYMQIAHVD